jgi:protochlorophyllide reductase
MSWSAKDMPDQSGRVAVVTGANSGLGKEITTRLADRGALVIMACRNTEKAHDAADDIRREVPHAQLELLTLDLADLASISACADAVRSGHDRLDLLVNNAGLLTSDRSTTADGFETHFGVNHLGPFALTALLRPLVELTAGSRVGTMSSVLHRLGRMDFDDPMATRGYRAWRAYAQSKLAGVLFSNELHHQFVCSGSTSMSVAAHPGGGKTNFGNGENRFLNKATTFAATKFGQAPRVAALPMLRALTDPAVRGGEFYGPRFLAVGPAVRERPSRRARNRDDAARLWHLSHALTQR